MSYRRDGRTDGQTDRRTAFQLYIYIDFVHLLHVHRQLIVVVATYWNRDCKFSWWCGTSKLKDFILNILGALEIKLP